MVAVERLQDISEHSSMVLDSALGSRAVRLVQRISPLEVFYAVLRHLVEYRIAFLRLA